MKISCSYFSTKIVATKNIQVVKKSRWKHREDYTLRCRNDYNNVILHFPASKTSEGHKEDTSNIKENLKCNLPKYTLLRYCRKRPTLKDIRKLHRYQMWWCALPKGHPYYIIRGDNIIVERSIKIILSKVVISLSRGSPTLY